MTFFRTIVTWLMALHGLALYAGESVPPAPEDVADSFFIALTGNWDGRAIETPVGPVDYDISFHVCTDLVIAGVAELSVSDHFWRFWKDNGELRLTFLSTFRGNQQPTQLLVSKIDGNTIWFYAPELNLLTLSVAMPDPHVDIRVFHHHEPHVHIRLTRPDNRLAEAAGEGDIEKSCRKL